MTPVQVLRAVYIAVLLLSTVIAFLYFKWLKAKQLALFAPYLLYVFAQEFILIYFRELFFTPDQRNHIVYSVHRLITVIFFCFIYYRLIILKTVRPYIAILAIVFTLAFVITFGFLDSIFNDNNKYLGLARAFIITIYGLLFLFSYFNLDNRAQEKHWSPWLWITIGIVVFYPVISISQMFQMYLYKQGATIYGFKLYNMIPQLMSIFMYSCFCYAFYLCKKRS
ncbi:MAG TPA: hypothetical protein VF476_07990 [Chitinophagaceae bacterium]